MLFKYGKGKKVENESMISLQDVPNVFIPDSYIENPQQRLAMYRRFLKVKTSTHLKKLQLECEDRFGKMPKKMTEFVSTINQMVVI